MEEPHWWCPQCMSSRKEFSYKECPECKGSGRIDDASLDPHRLAVLADALEDAGCEDANILQHLRGFEKVRHFCGQSGHSRDDPNCYHDEWNPKRGPCVRGCAVIDLLLGKE